MSRLLLNASSSSRFAAGPRLFSSLALAARNACWTRNTIFLRRNNNFGRTQTTSGVRFKIFAARSSKKRLNKKQKGLESEDSQEANSEDIGKSTDGLPPIDALYSDLTNTNSDAESPVANPSRSAVIKACSVTSGLILALGVFVRQASHFAFTEGWLKLDPAEVSCDILLALFFYQPDALLVFFLVDFEVWHLELIVALVVLISSCRYILLKTWVEFAESSEAANQQVLSSLEPIDYMVVAFLPGISEELLFRGGLLPLFGMNWMSVFVVAAIFGLLHIGGGRKYSFAAWATFVGIVYGVATIVSSNMAVPMAAHSLNNLIGGLLWRYESTVRETSNS